MIHPAPKPEPATKKPRKPLQAKKWGVSDKPGKPLPPINIIRTAKRVARRSRERNSAENRKVRKDAILRSKGICECGCGLPFDTTFGKTSPDYPEFHHTKYDPPEGIAIRRQCHQRIELMQFGHRRHGKVR